MNLFSQLLAFGMLLLAAATAGWFTGAEATPESRKPEQNVWTQPNYKRQMVSDDALALLRISAPWGSKQAEMRKRDQWLLLGIINQGGKPVALLQSKSTPATRPVRVISGLELSDGTRVRAVGSNHVELENDGELLVLKMFAAKPPVTQ